MSTEDIIKTVVGGVVTIKVLEAGTKMMNVKSMKQKKGKKGLLL